MSFQYGRFLVVDLAGGNSSTRTVDRDDAARFFGGAGIGAKLFIDEGDDAVVVANGLLTGLAVPTACKTSILFKSPLTGVFGETSVGGFWGAELKKTGFDGLVIKGESETPVGLFISDEGVEIRDASHLWGLDTFRANRVLSEELPTGSKIGLIGPAGENGVPFASIMFDGEFARAAGRCGAGCVFGKKKIKGIFVKGSGKPGVHDSEGLKTFTRRTNRTARSRAAGLTDFGTAGAVARREKSGDLPIKNFSLGLWKGVEKISGQAYAESMRHKRHACFMCPIACAKSIEIKSGEFSGLVTSQPEYETAGSLGSNLLNDDPVGLAVANRLCNEYGLDTISTGSVIGFLFECCERGVVATGDLGLKGVPPTWGNVGAIHDLIRMIAARRGIGEILSWGVKRAAEHFGRGSDWFAVHSKGLELPMHDPRALVSVGATYATGNRGASHNEAPAYYIEEGMKIADMGFPENPDPHTSEGKGVMTAQMQNLSALFDALGVCKFMFAGGASVEELRRMVKLSTGWTMDKEEFLSVGERIYTIKRLYNERLGVGRDDDTLPPRILSDKRGTGGSADVLPDLETMLNDLYEYRGWDDRGRVTAETARKLGLADYLPPEGR